MNAQQLDVIRRILDLATSARVELEYVSDKNREGNFESAARVLTDVIASFVQIQEALPVVGLTGENPVQEASALLQEGFRYYVERYEVRDYAALRNITELTLLPRYKTWQEALEQALHLRLAF